NITIAGDYSGEFARIKDSVESTAEELSAYISEISLVLNHMADKNLTDFISREYLGEFVIIKDSLNKIIDNFNAFVSEIKYAAESVEVEAENVSGAGADLSRGAVEQTRAIEDLRIAIEDISHEAAVNAENAASAARMSEKSRSNAVEGNKKMESMLLAMDGVKQAANSISNIIDIMSSVASQTNLLAINASIEAARAGDKGRGFGVVADQIRDLANRSQDAAKQSQAIIENSLRKTEEGIHYAQETSEALHSIAGLVTEASRLIIDISGASEKQMQAIGGFSDKISQISTIIHNNSSLATQSVTAAQKLTEQSALLDALIEKFLLKSFSGQISGDSFGDFDALQDALSTG
ncbi:MAG: methyl-accepting chemotaxis protein, partial [Clostridiales bacterium]|nr:methyl-accepting chemotaxis protein [Clostridiales bacterium]